MIRLKSYEMCKLLLQHVVNVLVLKLLNFNDFLITLQLLESILMHNRDLTNCDGVNPKVGQYNFESTLILFEN